MLNVLLFTINRCFLNGTFLVFGTPLNLDKEVNTNILDSKFFRVLPRIVCLCVKSIAAFQKQ